METENMEIPDLVLDEKQSNIEPIYVVVATRVRRYRKRRHLTISQVAARAGVSYGVISTLENAQHRTRLDIIEKIARVLKVDLKTLIG